MNREELVMFCTCDLGGQLRGKTVPARDLEKHLQRGVGWTPTNTMITAFGQIAESAWGSFGDVVLQPDPRAGVRVDYGDDRPVDHFYLADILSTDGKPWPGCPRGFLRSALDALERETGQRVVAAFEHEFYYTGTEQTGTLSGYHRDAVRRHALFGEVLLHALTAAAVEPENFMSEFGPGQFEVTTRPAVGLAAADRAVVVRELVRGVAQRMGHRASFSPIMVPNGAGNGVHVHMSLLDAGGRPTAYDPDARHGLSELGGRFIAGILKHMPALCALTAPSAISYLRLAPNRWSAAWNNLGYRDRESGVRICPLREGAGPESAGQFNFEYRAADATASPYMALGALVWAGLEGIRRGYPIPVATTHALTDADRRAMGIVRIPQSLPEALAALEADELACASFAPELLRAYLGAKGHEFETVKALTPDELCARYREVY